MKRSKAQLNAISRAYSNKQYQEWLEYEVKYPLESKELNLKYKYVGIKLKKIKLLINEGII